MSKEDFLKKAKEVHGDLYDYSLVDYKNNKTKVKIICKEHGVFEQRPDNHLYCKGGCPFCYGTHKKSKESFILDAILIHGDLYDYSLVDYKNNKTKVKIICKEHGVFEQTPLNHIINKNGCYKCGIISIGIKSKEREILSQDEFLKRIKLIHNDLYDYSLVKYKGFRYKIKIICSIHGIFEQLAGNHLNGSGCPICKLSKGENKIKQWLQKYLIKFIFQKRFSGCKNKTELKFDFYLPEYNTCIEFDGRQHFEPVSLFGGKISFQKIKKNDEIKNRFCLNNNINLIRVPFDIIRNNKKVEKLILDGIDYKYIS